MALSMHARVHVYAEGLVLKAYLRTRCAAATLVRRAVRVRLQRASPTLRLLRTGRARVEHAMRRRTVPPHVTDPDSLIMTPSKRGAGGEIYSRNALVVLDRLPTH